jgi:hypothetical protein
MHGRGSSVSLNVVAKSPPQADKTKASRAKSPGMRKTRNANGKRPTSLIQFSLVVI